MDERHRIDVWLKLVCLIKHRSEAAEACRGGHVKINGQRAKPAAVVRQERVSTRENLPFAVRAGIEAPGIMPPREGGEKRP